MTGRHPLAWLPPFLAGAAAAMAAMVAVGLLLYSGNGFLRALTVVLATLLGAFALGLWSAPPPGMDRPVEALRRRWLTVLLVYVAAALAAAGWSFLGGLASGAVTRGAGLALLAAAPLWSVGALLGTMSAVHADLRLRGPGAAAAAGAAVGAVFTGVFFVRIVAPFAMHVFFLIVLSGGALVHGWILDHQLEPVGENDPEGEPGEEKGDAEGDARGVGSPDEDRDPGERVERAREEGAVAGGAAAGERAVDEVEEGEGRREAGESGRSP